MTDRYTIRPLTDEARTRMTRRATEASPFRASWSSTTSLLTHELAAIRARDIVLMLDIDESDLRLDLSALRSRTTPRSPAVALALSSPTKGDLLFGCNRFRDHQDNVRAIALSLEALRKVERFGMVQSNEPYVGWAVLPPVDEDWVTILAEWSGLTPAAVRVDPQAAYRLAAVATHPDKGGAARDFVAVKGAYARSQGS